jgi:hypothetical protein
LPNFCSWKSGGGASASHTMSDECNVPPRWGYLSGFWGLHHCVCVGSSRRWPWRVLCTFMRTCKCYISDVSFYSFGLCMLDLSLLRSSGKQGKPE